MTMNRIILTKMGIFVPVSLDMISKGIDLLPYGKPPESLPGPLVFKSLPGGPEFFSAAWFVTGILLLLSTFIGHKFYIRPRGALTKFRMDDAVIILTCFLFFVWGCAHYGSYIHSLFEGVNNNADRDGRNFLPWSITGGVIWYVWFSQRSVRELKGKNDPVL